MSRGVVSSIALVLLCLVALPVAARANPTSPPDDLWRPAPGTTPESGTYVHLDSAEGDYVGLGESYLYTRDTAKVEIAHASGVITVRIEGNEWWHADLSGPDALTYLEPGYYGELGRYPFHDPERGGLQWGGEGRGCQEVFGWFVVDEIVFEHNEMVRLRMRFEQQCSGEGNPPLHGEISYDADDTGSGVPANPRPVPTGLWQPAAHELPPGDTYVHLVSEPGDYLGGGGTYTYTPDAATLSVHHSDGHIVVSIAAEEEWEATFAAPDAASWITHGYHGDLRRYPFHNPAYGGLTWRAGIRACNTLFGWFVVDDITYRDGALASLLMRFEQRCDGEGAPPLHGEIRWRSTADYAEPGTGGPPRYSDIAASPHREAILAVSEQAIAAGYADGTYRPAGAVTRGQMATFLARALRLPAPSADAPRFSDTAGDPHEDAIRAVAEAGIASGYSDGTYRPRSGVRRDQMATFLTRAFELAPPDGDAPSFTDTRGNTHETAIRSVAQASIAGGYPDGTYRPALVVTRGQMATFLARALGLL